MIHTHNKLLSKSTKPLKVMISRGIVPVKALEDKSITFETAEDKERAKNVIRADWG
jgi:hypothetical protein